MRGAERVASQEQVVAVYTQRLCNVPVVTFSRHMSLDGLQPVGLTQPCVVAAQGIARANVFAPVHGIRITPARGVARTKRLGSLEAMRMDALARKSLDK